MMAVSWRDRLRIDGPFLAFAVAAVLLAFSYEFSCHHFADFFRPWFSLEDIPLLSGYFKASSEGDLIPFVPHLVSRLNAPFRADWYDFPTTEELIYAYGGLLTRIWGIVTAYNLSLLTGHFLAVVTFYLCARHLGARPGPAALTAVSFGASRYIFVRDTVHINLVFCWHLPCYWVATRHLWQGTPLTRRGRGLLLLLCFVASWQHPYYWYFWMLMLFPCWFVPAVQGRFRQGLPALWASAASLFFLILANVDTIAGWILYGRSLSAWQRTIDELILYGLRLPDFFLPRMHHWKSLQEWTQLHYFIPMTRHASEMDSAYLGLFGILLAGGLFVQGLRRLLKVENQDFFFGMSLWLLAVALCGGLNLCFGTFGLLLFRCSCRFCICLQAGWLLYGALLLSKSKFFCERRWGLLLLPMLAWLICLDQTPPPPEALKDSPSYIQTQQGIVDYLESKVPGACVFQWPVKGYPETPILEKLPNYEPLVAYLLSRTLRFSYGDCLGRLESQWQWELNDENPQALLDQVQEYGFSAFILYRQGLKPAQLDRWDELERQPDFKSDNGDHWIYLLKPGSGSPPIRPTLNFVGFMGEEKDHGMSWRWSNEPAGATIHTPQGSLYRFSCSLNSYGIPRDVKILLDGREVWQGPIYCEQHYQPIMVAIPGGIHRLEFLPTGLALPVTEGTKLSFRIINPELVEGSTPR